MRASILAFLIIIVSSLVGVNHAQDLPSLSVRDTVVAVDADCSLTLTLQQSAMAGASCDRTDSLLWHVVADLWADGAADCAVSSYAPRNYTTWRVDELLSLQFGLPADVLWMYTPPTESGESFVRSNGQAVHIPEDLGGMESEHVITYEVTDACGNVAEAEQGLSVRDLKPPSPFCKSLIALLPRDPDGCGPLPYLVEITARDFSVGVYDNCTPEDELLYVFDGVAPVSDTTISYDGEAFHVGIDVPHYYDALGFVDFASTPYLDYPVSGASTYLRYATEDIYLWLPEIKSAMQVISSFPHVFIKMSVVDASGNMESCEIFLPDVGRRPPESRMLDSTCSHNLGFTSAIGAACEVGEDRLTGTVAIDLDRDCAIDYVISTNLPESYMDWTQVPDTLRVEGADSTTLWLYVPYLVKQGTFSDARGSTITLPVTASMQVGFGYNLIYDVLDSCGRRYKDTRQRDVRDATPPAVNADYVLVVPLYLATHVIFHPGVEPCVELDVRSLEISSDDNCTAPADLHFFLDRAPDELLYVDYAALSGSEPTQVYYDMTGALIEVDTMGTGDVDSTTLDLYYTAQAYRWDVGARSASTCVPIDDLDSTYRLLVGDAAGNVSTSTFIIRTITSTDELVPTDPDLLLTPNPFVDEVTITWQQYEYAAVSIDLYTMTGSRCLSYQSQYATGRHTHTISRSAIPTAGVYILQLQVGDQQYSQRLVVL